MKKVLIGLALIATTTVVSTNINTAQFRTGDETTDAYIDAVDIAVMELQTETLDSGEFTPAMWNEAIGVVNEHLDHQYEMMNDKDGEYLSK